MRKLPELLYNEPLKNYSTIRIGGNAEKFLLISSEQQLSFLKDNLPAALIGGGSNVLFSDNGCNGLVVAIRNQEVEIDGAFIRAGAGVRLPHLARLCQELGLSGAEWAGGIPSCVGGAVYMNAGAYGKAIGDVLTGCRVLREGRIVELSLAGCGLGYRTSIFSGSGDIIVSADFRFTQDDKNVIKARMCEYAQMRKRTQPSGLSLGSVFKNADRPAGYYIDRAGLKGLREGGLSISQKHANFIINDGTGTACGFLRLVDTVKAEVYRKFGVLLKEEFVKIGDF